jgi:teichuronic acid biosynthesis protein TuaE
MSTESGPAPPPQPTVLARALFGALPLLAAGGPVATVYRGLFAFRLACAFLVVHAVLFLLGRGRWRAPDVWLFATTIVMIGSGLIGLGAIRAGSDSPYSEFLAVALGLTTALSGRAWQRRIPLLPLSLSRGWVVAGLVVSIAAAFEVVTGLHLPSHLQSAGSEPSVVFGNPNALAVFVVMANVWALPVHRAGGALWRTASWSLVLATAPVLLATDARLAMAMWLLLVAWFIWSVIRRSTTGLAGIGAALVPVGAALAAVTTAPLVVSYVTEVSTSGSSGSVRAVLSLEGLQYAAQQRGLPSGPGSFEALIVENALQRTGGLVNAHNIWVEILVQYGAPSLVLLFAWMIACVVAESGARTVTGPAVVTLLVLGLVDSSLLDDASLWLFVLTLAMTSRIEITPTGTGIISHRVLRKAGVP